MSAGVQVNRELASIGIIPTKVMVNGRPVRMMRAQCLSCGTTQEVRHKLTAAPDLVRQNFETKGWTGFGKRPLCPQCSTPPKSKAPQRTEESMDASKIALLREPTIAEIIKIIGLLDEHFADGRYRNGWSDEAVAKKLCLPRAMVTKVREASPDHGPLKGDPEIDAIRSEVASLKGMLAEIEARLDKAERRLAGAA